VKTQQAGKDLASALMVCEWWRLAVALLCKWPINPSTNPNPAYSHTLQYGTISSDDDELERIWKEALA
jgi:hypothetical protein